ncbi:MAG: hypothetical protein WAV76_03815 [Bacteroidota bacterium]
MRIMKIIACSILPVVVTVQVFAQQDTTVSNRDQEQSIPDSATVEEDTSAVTEYGNFILLENGEKLYGKVEKVVPYAGQPYLLLDGLERHDFGNVRAYQDDNGFFVKLRSTPWSYEFVRRVIEGKIDFFSSTYLTFVDERYGYPFAPYRPYRRHAVVASEYIDYFSKDGVDLLPVNFHNLYEALSDNPESMKYLDDYRTMETVQWGLLIGGTAVTLIGLSTSNYQTHYVSPLVYAGCLATVSAYIPFFMKDTKLQLAIKVYNR